jgi:hypothetical protein
MNSNEDVMYLVLDAMRLHRMGDRELAGSKLVSASQNVIGWRSMGRRVARRFRRESTLTPPPNPPRPPDDNRRMGKALLKLLWFVVIHRILGR